MRASIRVLIAWLGLFAGTAAAHFNMLLPQTATAKKGEALTITYQWGHPFEHQLFDAPQPQSLIVLRPDGKRADLTNKLEKITRKAGSKDVSAYQLHFTPQQRGDHVFVLRTPPIWMEEDGEFLQDTVKMVLHVQAQKGWDASSGAFEFVPLTRPYGLRPGMVFQVEMPSDRRDAGPTREDRRDAGPTKLTCGDRALQRRAAEETAAGRAHHAHGSTRSQRRRHDHVDRTGLVVFDRRPSAWHAEARRQELSTARAFDVLGVRG